MHDWFFVSDLHGSTARYGKLFEAMLQERPAVVLLGGDLLPPRAGVAVTLAAWHKDFLHDFLAQGLSQVRAILGSRYPRVLVILGNDDPRVVEPLLREIEGQGLWTYIHNRKTTIADFPVYGYSYVPPSPYTFKDWERYDVSRYTDPGCVSPEDGYRTVPVSPYEARFSTIQADLEGLVAGDEVARAILLFHGPPYQTALDRAALDGKMINHVPMDIHVGSIAIRRFIDERQPLLTLHGHVHESPRITGRWQTQLGRTHLVSAAHHGPELALVRFSPWDPGAARRDLL